MLSVWKACKRVCERAGFPFLDRSDFAYAKKLFVLGYSTTEIADMVLTSIYGLEKCYDC